MEPAHQTAAMALSDDALLFAEFDIDGNAALDFDEVRACAIMSLVGSHTPFGNAARGRLLTAQSRSGLPM